MLTRIQIIVAVGILGVLSACGDLEKVSIKKGEGNAGSYSSLTDEELLAKYRIFDRNYNFLKTSTSNFTHLQQNYPVFDGSNSSHALLNADDFLAVRMKLLESAVRSVRLQSLIFTGDEIGWAFADKLIELKRRGVDVRVIIDSVSNLDIKTQNLYFQLEQNGIMVEGYEPLYMWPFAYGKEGSSFDEKFLEVNRRYHEKIFVVDAEIPEKATAITGGVNYSNEYYRVDNTEKFNMWQDQDIILKGAIVQHIANGFDKNFGEMVGHRRTHGSVNFDGFWNTVQMLASTLGRSELISIKKPKFNSSILAQVNARRNLTREIPLLAPLRMRHLANSPRNQQWYIEDAYLELINSARQSIEISNSYFIPSNEMIAALQAAKARGVNVRILTNSTESSEFVIVGLASRATYKNVLATSHIPSAGSLTLHEWLGDKVLHNGEGHLHTKFAVFDNEVTIIGSYNLDPRSRELNTENIIITLDSRSATELANHFNELVAPNNSRQITLEEANKFQQPSGDFMTMIKQSLIPSLTPLL